FISFPALLLVGLPPIVANATNNTAMWLGTLSSVGGYREELAGNRRRSIPLLAIGLVGGVLGAILLLVTPETIFTRLIPYLLLFATLVFAASDRLRHSAGASESAVGQLRHGLFLYVGVLAVAIYGGYFGAGFGILILALFSLAGWGDVHRMNALKSLMAACVNGVAVIPFAIDGKIAWEEAAVVSIGAILGGYFGARLARRVEPLYVRRFVIVVGIALTLIFFVHRA
ncbi:MAG: sulfite exporter TauE/SafE family protein, partial [Candidatus Baltobacteraceae bacterium]